MVDLFFEEISNRDEFITENVSVKIEISVFNGLMSSFPDGCITISPLSSSNSEILNLGPMNILKGK